MGANSKKSIRIKITPGDEKELYVTQKLEQNFEKLEFLSLSLTEENSYRMFSSSTGCVTGRVSSNKTGIPNAKISVFIKLTDLDKQNPDKFSIYPFSTPLDKDSNGKRYNLLNKLKQLNPFSGWKSNSYGLGYFPKYKSPVGTIPDKVEILTNPTWTEIYSDYYKLVTSTNSAGDFLLIGVPVGTQLLHCEVDSTNIGKFSSTIPILESVQQLPIDVLSGTDLDQIPTIQALNKNLNVIPFFGSSDQNEVGITRCDFEVRVPIIPSATLITSGAASGERSFWGNRSIFQGILALKNLCIFIGCSKEQLGSDPGVAVKFCFRLHLKFKSFTIIDQCIGSCDLCDPDATLAMKICIKIVIANIIPIFCLDPISFQSCILNGKELDQGSVDLTYLGAGNFCGTCSDLNTSDAFKNSFTSLLDFNQSTIKNISLTVFGIKPSVSDDDILSGNFSIIDDIEILSEKQYARIPTQDGMTILQLPMNRRKVVTDFLGNEIIVDNSDPNGIPTEFWGYIIFEMNGIQYQTSGSKISADTVKIKVPACTDYDEDGWIKSAYRFQANELYTTSQYMLVTDGDHVNTTSKTGLFLNVNNINNDPNIGDDLEMVNNNQLFVKSTVSNVFMNNWVNGFLMFYGVAHKRKKGKRLDVKCETLLGTNGNQANQRTRNNSDPLGGGKTNTYYILNNQYFPTNFAKINKDEFLNIIPSTRRGLSITNPSSEFMKNNNTSTAYFYKGLYDGTDAVKELIKQDII